MYVPEESNTVYNLFPLAQTTQDWTSPGIVCVQTVAACTGIGAGAASPADEWEQRTFIRTQAKSLNGIAGFPSGGTGSDVTFVVTKTETRTVDPTEEENLVASPTLEEQIATLRSSLSLQVKELAETLQVERPTIYSWINGRNTPHSTNRERLHALYGLARQWNKLSNTPLGSALHAVDEKGRSIFHLLQTRRLPTTDITARLRMAAQASKTAMEEPLSTRPKATLRDLAKKHGIDLSRIADQREAIDLETGKRIYPE